jgi:peptidoglycan/LPS O-acetylase OafA/YrhL
MYWIIYQIFRDELTAFSRSIGLLDWKNEVGFIIAFIATVTLAMLSYRFLERPFLRLKNRYTLIPSRDMINEHKIKEI